MIIFEWRIVDFIHTLVSQLFLLEVVIVQNRSSIQFFKW